MKEADRQAIALLNQIHEAQAAGGDASFASLTGSPEDNAALNAALDAKQGDLGYTPVPDTRTVNGHALSGNVTVSKGDVGLGNADNTADTAKPVSTDQATAIAGKVSDTAYDATSWDGVTTIAPSKNAVRDKIEAVVASIPAAHSGGVIGTATFSSVGDVSSLVISGIISGVTYESAGSYIVTFTPAQPDAGYLVIAGGYDGATTHVIAADTATKLVGGFTLKSLRTSDAAPHDSANVELVILRLSQ